MVCPGCIWWIHNAVEKDDSDLVWTDLDWSELILRIKISKNRYNSKKQKLSASSVIFFVIRAVTIKKAHEWWINLYISRKNFAKLFEIPRKTFWIPSLESWWGKSGFKKCFSSVSQNLESWIRLTVQNFAKFSGSRISIYFKFKIQSYWHVLS